MKNHKHDFKTEAHIAATYKAFVTHPKSSIKPFNSDFLSTLIISNQTPPNTDRIANTKTISLLTPRSISSLQRPKTERPPHLSKTAAEYHEIPFRNSNREYEIFQKLFKEKVVEDVGVGLPKYEKKGVIQEIIEKEYNFNRYGEVKRPSQTKRRKSSLKIAGSLSKTRISSNNNYVYGTLGQNLTNLKGKIRFSYQKMEEEEEEVVKRPKIDKEFFETIRTNYVKKIRTIFQDKQVKESQKIAENELERLLEEFKIFIDQTNEEKEDMKKQIKDSWEKEREESRVAETLKIKYRFLETQHTNLDKECQELKKNLASLDKFIILYEKLNKKLQDYGLEGSLDKLFQKMEYLENVCLELTKRKLELEDSNLSQEKERLKLKNHYEDIINRLHKEGNEREKFVKSLKEAQDAKNLEYEIDFSYKPQYMKLFNQILQLYAKWTKNLDIFQKDQQIERLDNNLPNTALETPEEVLCLLDKIIMISTPQSAQAYIRKIIGSSLRLLRRFLPEKLIEMYEPEKFYCYLSEYIDKLQREVQKCRNDVEVLKRKNKESLKKIKENSTEKKSNDKGLKNITDIAHERRKALK